MGGIGLTQRRIFTSRITAMEAIECSSLHEVRQLFDREFLYLLTLCKALEYEPLEFTRCQNPREDCYTLALIGERPWPKKIASIFS